MTPAQRAKVSAWREQAAALDAPAYRITFTPRREGLHPFNQGKGRGPEGGERFYSADEVESLIPLMSRHNMRGYDVYVTPIDSEHHYLVVDDMTAESHSRLTGAGYQPALVQESSDDNRQAVLKAPRQTDGGRAEQSAANRVVRRLNKEVGDPDFSGAMHPFRVAGFSNKKPGKQDAFTRLIEATGAICQRTVERLAKARQWVADQQAEQSRGQRAEAIRHAVPASHHGSYATPADEYRCRARNQPAESDWSRVDFGVAVGMLRDGWQAIQVEQAIIEASPALSDRHRDTDGYARRTIEKAGETADAQQQQPEQRRQEPGPRPGARPKGDPGMSM
jgi:hypothetical protein